MVVDCQRHFPAKEKPRFCRAFKGALGRTRTCDLLIRRGTLRLFIGPVASRLAHDDGCFAWPIDLVDPSESARIPSCRWYRRWYRRSGFHRAFCTALTHHPASPSNVVTVARLTLDRLVLVRIQVRQLPESPFVRGILPLLSCVPADPALSRPISGT